MDRHELVSMLAAMDETEFDDVTAEARGDTTEQTPQERAVAALRKSRGLDRKRKATPDEAFAAFKRAATGRD